MSSFIPRTIFPTLDSLPRSYYLGHHAAGLARMKTMISQIDLIIECRDARVPITSHNPMFEETLAGRDRMIIYTKKDLAIPEDSHNSKKTELLRKWHHPTKIIFSNHKDGRNVRHIVDMIRETNASRGNLTGSQVLVVGMPNVGKSSLLNALRYRGMSKGKAARTGAQPGVTRKISTGVKIIDGDDDAGSVYVLDTPGVFMPYVPDAESMLKLGLCGAVKDTILPPTNLADYLLFQMNRHDPTLYGAFCPPTNDVMELLETTARKTGRLSMGGELRLEAAALWLIQRWREGKMGVFMLDDVSDETLERYEHNRAAPATSFNQARKAGKEAIRVKNKLRRSNSDPV